MAEAAELQAVENSIPETPKDKSCLLGVIGRYLEACGVDRRQPVLVLGGGQEDTDILTACGFEQIVMSNLDDAGLALEFGGGGHDPAHRPLRAQPSLPAGPTHRQRRPVLVPRRRR